MPEEGMSKYQIAMLAEAADKPYCLAAVSINAYASGMVSGRIASRRKPPYYSLFPQQHQQSKHTLVEGRSPFQTAAMPVPPLYIKWQLKYLLESEFTVVTAVEESSHMHHTYESVTFAQAIAAAQIDAVTLERIFIAQFVKGYEEGMASRITGTYSFA